MKSMIGTRTLLMSLKEQLMQSISFNLDNPQWEKEFPEYKTIISDAVKNISE